MTDYTLVRPSDKYEASRENMRNRRIEELFKRQEMLFNAKLASMTTEVIESFSYDLDGGDSTTSYSLGDFDFDEGGS